MVGGGLRERRKERLLGGLNMFVFVSDQNQRAYFRDHATVLGANAITEIEFHYRPLPSAKVWAPYIVVVNLHLFHWRLSKFYLTSHSGVLILSESLARQNSLSLSIPSRNLKDYQL